MVPASTILLAVATAIPFGLAIRDTVENDYEREPRDEEADLDQPDEVGLAAAEASYAQQRAQEAIERRQRHQRIRALVGRDPATLGPVFSSIRLGDPIGTGSVESTPDAQLILRDDGAHSYALDIQLERRDEGDCDHLESTMRTAWDAPRSLDHLWIWVGASQRAVWNPEDCSLTFERISSLEALVTRSVALVGTPAKALLEDLGERMETASDEQITWPHLGVGTGYGVALMTADVRKGKVVAVTAALHLDARTQIELAAQITRVVGASPSPSTEASDGDTWKPTRKTPRIQLVEGAPQVVLTVGSPPE